MHPTILLFVVPSLVFVPAISEPIRADIGDYNLDTTAKYVIPSQDQDMDIFQKIKPRHPYFKRAESKITTNSLTQSPTASIVTTALSSESTPEVRFTLASSIASDSSYTVNAAPTGQTVVSLFNVNMAQNTSYATTTYLGKILAIAQPNTVYEVDCILKANTSICGQAITVTQGSATYLRAESTPTASASGGYPRHRRQALGTGLLPSRTVGGNYLSCSLESSPTSAVCVEQTILSRSSATPQAAFNGGFNNTVKFTSTFAASQVAWDELIVTAGYNIITGNETATASTSSENGSPLRTRTPITPTAVSPQVTQMGSLSAKTTTNSGSTKSPQLALLGVLVLVKSFGFALA